MSSRILRTLKRAWEGRPATRAQFDGFHGGDFRVLHGEPENGSHQVPALTAAGSGVHMKQTEGRIARDFQNVGVAADEEGRAEALQVFARAGIVIAGVAADVGHEDAEAEAVPVEIAGKIRTQFGAVDVAVNAAHGAEGAQAVENLRGAEITGVPDLIALAQVMQNLVVQIAVGVGKQANAQLPS